MTTDAARGAVTIEPSGDDELRVALSGEVDMGVITEELCQSVSASRVERATVDLSAVTFMDSTALGFLVIIRSASQQPPTLVGVPPGIHRLLLDTGLLETFDTAE